jgi:hypothetical protein
MRRALFLAPVVGVLAVGGFLLFRPADSSAKPGDPPTAPAATATSGQLPVAQAILYSSGVGYFQREGTVDGSQRIDLTFPVEDVNDLLKSMVLQDHNNGHISAVSYDSQAPVEKTLQSFAINLTGNPGYGAILTQARGEKVEVTLQQGNAAQPGNVTGTIIGVEKKKESVKDGAVETECLNLWCAEGMRAVKLNDVLRVRFLNPVLEGELKRALETVALSHDTAKKSVSVMFSGEGKREVSVAYVVENPIWKTSYRLVLPNKKDAKPSLQGWAVVENATEEDWKDVRMALVSGRPISFRMDLYQPLYVPRPLVEPELFASLRPPTYNANLDRDLALAAKPADAPAAGGFGGGRGGFDKGKEAKQLEKADALGRLEGRRKAGEELQKKLSEDMNLGAGIQSAAATGSLGDFFQYTIQHPVSLPRQKAAMLPIVQKEVEADRVSIYNERVQAKHPLLGLKFKNTTGMHLMQGPVTVFEGSSYAGDTRFLDIQPKDERLVSYAIDLGTEVEPKLNNDGGPITKIIARQGVVYQTNRARESKNYKVVNRSEHDRVVLIEHPYRPEFALVSKVNPVERARDVYRFEVKVPAGKDASLDVVEERDAVSTVQINNADDNTIRFFLSQKITSEKVKQALEHAQQLKAKRSATERDLNQARVELKEITDDQARIRQNLPVLPQTSEAFKTYVKKLADQEPDVERLQKSIKELTQRATREQQEIDNYLNTLNVE